MEGDKLLIRNASQVITCSGFAAKRGAEMSNLHIIDDGAVVISGGIITHVGPTSEILRTVDADDYLEIDATGRTLLPGFVYTAHARNIRVSIIMGYIVFLTHY